MRDSMLELWLRLLALHLPEPNDYGEHESTTEIRNRWLLASRGYFTGFVPHSMEFACSTPENRAVVELSIKSLMSALENSSSVLNADVLNLLGNEGCEFNEVDRDRLLDIGYAFIDLMNGQIDATAHSTEIMPGSNPYPRPNAT